MYVFPELHKTPDGALEAEFYAFKIPDSTFLVFQATVRTCRGPCEPVICTDRGRGHGSFPSWGRKKRQAVAGDHDQEEYSEPEGMVVEGSYATTTPDESLSEDKKDTNSTGDGSNPEEEVHELLRVYLSRADIPSAAESKAQVQLKEQGDYISPSSSAVCVTESGYYAMVTALTILTSLLLAILVTAFFVFKKPKFATTVSKRLV